MEDILRKLIDKNRNVTQEGKVATYIPGLGKIDPWDLGICVADMEGNIYKSGNYDKKFTIQSISKTISLMLALIDNGEELVFEKVGMEPTGDAFNSIIKLETIMPSRPLNPMINAGAIVISSLIKGRDEKEKFRRLLDFIRKISGNDKLNINEEIYLSEKNTGDRNRAMAYFMKDVGIIEGNIEEILDMYFKQCSIEVDCIDIAKIGLFLANRGVLPETGERVISERIARTIKTFMITCGMYNGSGEFAIKVGIPAKSGVGGGIMASIPHRMGIGTYGPSLDDKGNSIGGYKILEDLSNYLNLSIF
ncbi:glutaminase A [Clostridium sp. D2Q-14]|uniref:glutaminase A n=1 Tax=Anaeromonas gelatinilytica TaxID=2683194 RepID=UPI00193C64E3|nr:glutaminase A [Anaeromonas gelatinilytica]MBS4536581.1 glutaminase A [Anaeromonas gelatinilytica]